MSNQPDVIEKYLDQVCGYLQMMPEDDVAEIRCELREHLHLSVEDLIANSIDPAAAPGEAVRRFGRARRVGLDIAMKSPYAWMWKRAEDDEITLSIGASKVYSILFLLPFAIILFVPLIDWCFHLRWIVTLPDLVLLGVPGIAQGFFSAIAFIVHKASGKDFNRVSREIAIAARSFDANSLPRWMQNFNLHRAMPALAIALPFIENAEIFQRIRRLIVFGTVIALFYKALSYVRSEPYHGDYGGLLMPTMFIGQFIGEIAFLIYILHRRRLTTSKEEVGNA